MQIKLLYFCLSFFILLSGCSTVKGTDDIFFKELTKEQKELIYEGCCEIVLLKPTKDSITYEKKLPWDLVPYNIRNDKYYSIGTAFAISKNEILTAFHALSLDEKSLMYEDIYIRDRNKKVYSIDNILLSNNHKDFVKFTVKDKIFEKWFSINEAYELNELVYTAGNAYGEGIIIRKGELIGTIPESEEGKWNFLKSSSDVNTGNSGGPLLDKNCNVIGIVISRKDNISYSLPISEVVNSKENTGICHRKTFFTFSLFPEKSDTINLDFEIKLPQNYKDFTKIFVDEYSKFYIENMNNLFTNNKDEIFPHGESSLETLYGSSLSVFPQVIFKDKNNMKWYISELKTKESSLDNNGSIVFANTVDDFIFVDITKPENISLGELYTKPKIAIELILKGINIPRKMANQEIRILSFGDTYESNTYVDSYNRKWMINTWMIEYSDEAIISFSTPTPQGLVYTFKVIRTFDIDLWKYDLKKILDFVYISYYGKLEEWVEFLKYKNYLPDKFSSIDLSYEKDQCFSLKTDRVNMNIDSSVINLDDDTKLLLNFDFYRENEKVIWDIRRILLTENKKDNYFVLYKNLKPVDKLPENYLKAWEEIVDHNYPYNDIPFSDKGRTNVGSIYTKSSLLKDDNKGKDDFLYSIYLAREGKIDDEKMKDDLEKIKAEIKILE